MNITITREDENWLRQGIVKELIENYNYSKNDAILAFDDSPLLNMMQTDPEYVFHYDTRYWAKFIFEMQREYIKPNSTSEQHHDSFTKHVKVNEKYEDITNFLKELLEKMLPFLLKEAISEEFEHSLESLLEKKYTYSNSILNKSDDHFFQEDNISNSEANNIINFSDCRKNSTLEGEIRNAQ